MALAYDIRSDIRYAQGRKEGKLEGENAEKERIIKELLNSELYQKGSLKMEQIAEITQVPVERVRNVDEQLSK